jgi:betaine-aldehyde dehydrogenase
MRSFDRLFINGEWTAPTTDATFSVISPVTEQVIATTPEAREGDVDRAVEAARRAFDEGPWPRMAIEERAEILMRLVSIYFDNAEEMAQTITAEMGVPYSYTLPAHAQATAAILQYNVELGVKTPIEESRPMTGARALVRREPVGVVAAIVPWNTPQAVTMTKIGPALIAGCTVIIKPAEETPVDALLFARFVEEAGLPPGVVNVVPAGREVGEYLVKHDGVDKVAFTGSTVAGRRIASLCGERMKRCTMELGGKSAAVVLEDAKIDTVLNGLRDWSFVNNGQACIAQTRVLAPRSRYSEIVDGFADVARSLKIGDPFDEATQLGPLFAKRHRERIESYVEIGRGEGARVVTGGQRPADHPTGWFYEPTIFADVDNGMRIAQEEIFGPVIVVVPYEDEADAVRLANDSQYGLAGSVWTEDYDRGLDFARQIRTGTYGVNMYGLDLDLPLGGYKQSGLGRECGPEGLDAYYEIKAIALAG